MVVLTRERVPVVTGVLSALSVGIVFAAAGGAIPPSAIPWAPDAVLGVIPTVNVFISALALVTIGFGWYWIREGRIARHRQAMGLSVVLFVAFLGLYLYRLVAVGGATEFAGPATIRTYVYLPILFVHVSLAVICIPLLYYVILLVATHPVEDLGRTRHPSVGRVAATLWMTSFALGIVVYLFQNVLY